MSDIPYVFVIANLMYAHVYIRLDIAFAMSLLDRYQSNPSMDHYRATTKVMWYLKRTKDYIFMYRQIDSLEVVGYVNSDFGGCVDSWKSTLSYIFMLTSGALYWKSVK